MRWREAEAAVEAGDRAAAAEAAAAALAIARRLGSRWLAEEVEGLARRARLRARRPEPERREQAAPDASEPAPKTRSA